MISAFLLAFSGLVVPASAPDAAYSSSPIAHMKGHATLPAVRKNKQRSKVSTGCHPDSTKGRSCRHSKAMAEELSRKTPSAEVVRAPGMERGE